MTMEVMALAMKMIMNIVNYLPARSSSVSSIARTPRASSSWEDDDDFDDDDEDVDVDDDFDDDDEDVHVDDDFK